MRKDPGHILSSREYTLFVLTLVFACNNIDRQILSILLQPIGVDLKLNDLQLGLLSGVGFAAVYAIVGIPVAAWADRGLRRNIIAFALGLWSLMTVLSGFAQSFIQLLLARMGVGIGESGGTPPATAMISDLYAGPERATAIGIYSIGVGLGTLAGFPLGGLVYQYFGWRAAFFVAGAPGLILALIVRFTVPEPVRGASEFRADAARPSFVETVRFMLGQPSLLWLLMGCMFLCIPSNAFLAWSAPYVIRTFHVSVGEVGIALGLIMGALAGIGVVVVGIVCDRLSIRDLRWRPWTILLCNLVSLPTAWLAVSAPSTMSFYLLLAPASFVGLVFTSVAHTASHELVRVRMRATASAFTLFCLTFLGIGLGPTLVGLWSASFAHADPSHAVRDGLVVTLLIGMLGLPCLYMASRHYVRDVRRAQSLTG